MALAKDPGTNGKVDREEMAVLGLSRFGDIGKVVEGLRVGSLGKSTDSSYLTVGPG